MHKGLLLATAAGFAALVGTGSVNAADKLKVGVTATLEGTYTVLGEDGMRGYELAVEAHGGKVAGKEIETIVGSTDASPDSAVRAAKKLVEQDKVDILISPLSGSEGIAIRDYSKTQPQITVMNAGSGALETTYGDPSAGVTPSPTFYRTNLDGAQWQAGLGDYAYNVKHYKKIATVGEDYCLRLHAGDGTDGRVLQGRRRDHQALLGAARHQGLRFGYFVSCPMTSTPSISASAAPTP